MRLPALAVAVGAAAAGLLAVGPARAATAQLPPDTPTYACQTTQWVGGGDVFATNCIASNGAPISGSTGNPVMVIDIQDGQVWPCDGGADAGNYPASVEAHECELPELLA